MTRHTHHDIVADGAVDVFVTENPNESPSQAVLRGIAALKGTAERDLERLYDSVEPESLDELVEHSRTRGTDVSVEFTYEGYTVRVQDDEEIRISAPSSATRRP